MRRNPFFEQVHEHYLFQEIRKRTVAYKKAHPEKELLSLGIGDTTQPLSSSIAEQIASFAKNLASEEGYVGYGNEDGMDILKERINTVLYKSILDPETICISDGAKCDIGRLQILFGQDIRTALQDPTYPVYLDTGCILRKDTTVFLPCTPKNNFFPDVENMPPIDVLFLCSPNNPTGSAFSYEQLCHIVACAEKKNFLIVYDAAYSAFIQNDYPKTIYEIPGAKKVAIEVSSFSKIAGFTGIRLGWTIVPKELKYTSGRPLLYDYKRLIATFFNGASCLAQVGGIAALEPRGLMEIEQQIKKYREGTLELKNCFEKQGYAVYGGTHAPYLWIDTEKTSWEMFDFLLEEFQLITTPGVGFGLSGEGFIRVSGLAKSHIIAQAINRLER